jgi:hypothetical protein
MFQKDAHALTCELDTHADGSYAVIVVPHWDVATWAIERFTALPDALLRHAEIAQHLRETGWMLTRHADAPLAA